MAHAIPPHLRFWKFVLKGDSCWVWQGKRNERGYGKMVSRGRDLYAHRVSFEMHFRALAPGEVVRHRCDNTSCVNPAHLLAGTQADNMSDMHQRRRHAFGSSHKAAILNEAMVAEIKKRLGQGETQASVGRAFNLNCRHVGKIARAELWGHVQ